MPVEIISILTQNSYFCSISVLNKKILQNFDSLFLIKKMVSYIQKFSGTAAALITPFTPDLAVDYQSLENLLAHTMPHLDYLVVNGTTSESPTLSEEEKNKVLDFIVEKNTYQRPIVWGLGGYHTEHIISLLKQIDSNKISAVLSVSPPYNRPNQQGLIAHYTALADASPVPIILYNVPARTGNNIAAETTLKLAEHPNIVGIKEASGDIVQSICIATHKPDDFLLISGDDLLTLPLMSVGAVGVISVLANAFPKEFTQSVQAAHARDYVAAQKILYKLFELNRLIFAEGNPTGIKAVLQIQGLIKNYLRLPLVKASDSLYENLKQVIANL